MRIVIQRVKESSVSISGELHSSIGMGLLVFLGIEQEDGKEDVEWLVQKLVKLRIFADSEGVMNLSVGDVSGEIMVVSQFTLHASTKKGNRPSYIKAARPETAIPLYEEFLTAVSRENDGRATSGIFGADMQVGLVNDGPVTIWIDSKNRE